MTAMRAALDELLGGVAGGCLDPAVVFIQVGLPAKPKAVAWAKLRVLVVAYHPTAASQLLNLEMNRTSRTLAMALRWVEEGPGQLASLQLAGHNPATVLNQVARYILEQPPSPRRERLILAMLRDAAGLA